MFPIPGLDYVKLAGLAVVAIAAAALYWYINSVQHERDAAKIAFANAQAEIASKEATINELMSVHENDMAAIDQLRNDKLLRDKLILTLTDKQNSVTKTVIKYKDRINELPPTPAACNVLFPRDLATLDSVRELLYPGKASPTPDNPDKGREGSPTSRAPGAGPVTGFPGPRYRDAGRPQFFADLSRRGG